MRVEWKIILDYLPLFLEGLKLTLAVSALALLFSIPIGVMWGLLRLSKVKILSALAGLYIEIMRGIPLLVLLLWIFFVLGRILELGPFSSAVLGLTLFNGAFVAEIFRAGVQSVPKEQLEAARSLGMTHHQAMQYIVIPQSLRFILPPLASQFIMLIKDSSLVSVVSVVDLTLVARNVVATSFRPIEIWSFVALLYFALTFTLSRLIRTIEKAWLKKF